MALVGVTADRSRGRARGAALISVAEEAESLISDAAPNLFNEMEEVMEEGTFTGAGIDALPMPATKHVAFDHVEPEPRTRWQRLLAFLGLGD